MPDSTDDSTAVVASYVVNKLKDVPASYHSRLPKTSDPAKLAAAEQIIRSQYRDDLIARGVKTSDLMGYNGTGGKKPADFMGSDSGLSLEEVLRRDLTPPGSLPRVKR